MTLLCLQYNREFKEELVILYFEYAREDVEKGIMTWQMYFQGFKEAGKVCKFFPTYADIMERVKANKEKYRYPTFEALPAHRDKEQAQKYLKMIREKKFENN